MKHYKGDYIRAIAHKDILPPDLIGKIEEISLVIDIDILNFKVIKDFYWDRNCGFSYKEIHDLVRRGYLKEPKNAAFIPSKIAWMKC